MYGIQPVSTQNANFVMQSSVSSAAPPTDADYEKKLEDAIGKKFVVVTLGFSNSEPYSPKTIEESFRSELKWQIERKALRHEQVLVVASGTWSGIDAVHKVASELGASVFGISAQTPPDGEVAYDHIRVVNDAANDTSTRMPTSQEQLTSAALRIADKGNGGRMVAYGWDGDVYSQALAAAGENRSVTVYGDLEVPGVTGSTYEREINDVKAAGGVLRSLSGVDSPRDR